MSSYNWVLADGSIQSADNDRAYYELSEEQLESILTSNLSQFNNQVTLNRIEENIYLATISKLNDENEDVVICVKHITPGGRSNYYPDEFRIQQQARIWRTAVEQADERNCKGILLGIYKTSDIEEPIFCAFKLKAVDGDSSKSKQIKNEVISKAIINGFNQTKSKNEYICAFRKEFLFFYLKNSEWIHESTIDNLTSHTTDEHSISDDIEEMKQKGPSKPGINRIYFGAPGTGKSYGIKKFIQENGIENYSEKTASPNVFRITLHPEFGYNDFIGQVMPVVKRTEGTEGSSTIEYEFTPQMFTKALAKAFQVRASGEPVFLILEEMSRANVASVFGDLFQLLDRDTDGISEYKIDNSLIASIIFGEKYSDEKIYLPENIYIIGTVNTSDQNVYVMDTAFKRRFEFEYLATTEIAKKDGIALNDFQFKLINSNEDALEFTWLTLMRKLNEFIVKSEENGGLGLTEDKQLGQFFIKFRVPTDQDTEAEILSTIEEYNKNQISGKLLQYLWNDIEGAAYSTNKLFAEEVNSFGQLYSLAKQGKNFFSQEFLNLLS